MSKQPNESLTLYERFESKPARAGVAVTIALLSALALDGCAPSIKHTSTPTSIETSAPTETPTPTQTPTQAPGPTETMSPADNAAEADAIATFEALPKAAQLHWAYNYMVNGNSDVPQTLRAFEAQYAAESDDYNDVMSAAPASLADVNDPQKIITQVAALERFANTFTNDAPNYDRQKFIIAILKNGSASEAYPTLMSVTQPELYYGGGALAYRGVLTMTTPVTTSPLVDNGPGDQYVTIKDSAGTTRNYYLETFDTDNGPVSLWIRGQS
jgi:hypothetical protein